MPNFKYETIDGSGKTAKGVIEAANLNEASKTLRADGRFISSLAPDSGSTILNMKVGSPKLKTKDLMIICRQLSSLLGAGITVIRALDMLYQQIESKKAKEVIGNIYESIQTGKTLTEAFREQEKALPGIMIYMIAAGEESGKLDDVMVRLAEHFEKSAKLKNKVGAAMVYPIILVIVTLAVTIGLMVGIVPQFAKTLSNLGAELPTITKVVMGMSNNLITFWYIYILVIAVAASLFRAWKRSENGGLAWAKFTLKVPIVGKAIKMTAASNFTRTMATLLQSGINVLESMEITSRTLGNKYLERRLYDARNDIRKGVPLSRSIRGIEEFPPMICAMVAIGEESGTLDTILDRSADFFEDEADSAIAKMTAAMEPLIIVIMAVVVVTVIAACAMPILTMTSAIM